MREESDDIWIEEIVKCWTYMLKHEHLGFGEVSWRDHSSHAIVWIVDGVEEHVVRTVIHCS